MVDLDRIVRLKAVLALADLSRRTLYRKNGLGTFPRQGPISVHGARWNESAVNRRVADPAGLRKEAFQ